MLLLCVADPEELHGRGRKRPLVSCLNPKKDVAQITWAVLGPRGLEKCYGKPMGSAERWGQDLCRDCPVPGTVGTGKAKGRAAGSK